MPLLYWGLTGVVAATLLATLGILWRIESAPARPFRASMSLGTDDPQRLAGDDRSLALSPDGRTLVFVARAADGESQLYERSFEELEARPLSGTEGASAPFFSPDGRWVAFFTQAALKKVSLSGGAPMTLAEVRQQSGGTWGDGDTIVYATTTRGLYRVPASGGTPVEFVQLGEGEGLLSVPSFLPGGNSVLFSSIPQAGQSTYANRAIEVASLETGQRKVILTEAGTSPRYVSSGHLLFLQGTTLVAAPFDADDVELTGDPRPVLEGVEANSYLATSFAVASGTLVYRPAGAAQPLDRLVWVDREGAEEPLTDTLRQYRNPRLSPDGRRVAVWFDDGNSVDAWLLELSRGTLTRLTFDGGNVRPLWSPDGERVIFASNRNGSPYQIYVRRSDGAGSAEAVTGADSYRIPTSISSDGSTVVFRQDSEATGRDIGMVRQDGEEEPVLLLHSSFDEHTGMLSPDNRWLAYVSNESGREEVYVTPFPGPGSRLPISSGGGTEPVWAPSGRELFYRSGPRLMAVAVTTEPELQIGSPTLLFEGRYLAGGSLDGAPGTGYDVARDGRRFVMVKPPESAEPDAIVLVQNWLDELPRLVPTD